MMDLRRPIVAVHTGSGAGYKFDNVINKSITSSTFPGEPIHGEGSPPPRERCLRQSASQTELLVIHSWSVSRRTA
jgi:hypothetical protein